MKCASREVRSRNVDGDGGISVLFSVAMPVLIKFRESGMDLTHVSKNLNIT